jgi:hypothetical protein
MVGLSAYFLGKEGDGYATFLPVINETLLPPSNADFSQISSVLAKCRNWQAIHYFGPGNPSITYCVFLCPSSWNWYEVARDGELPWRTKTGLSGCAGYGQADIYDNMPFPGLQ